MEFSALFKLVIEEEVFLVRNHCSGEFFLSLSEEFNEVGFSSRAGND